MKISVIHPSRNRPEKARLAYDHWTKRGVPSEWIISLDSDKDASRYLHGYHFQFRDTNAKIIVNANRSITDAVNAGARETTGNLLIVVSDDFLCPDGWHDDLIKHLEGKRDFVGRVNDGNQGWICTLPLMDRAYYEAQGYLYNPAYLHMFCDTEMTAKAELDGKIVEIPMVFRHEHPMYGKARWDEVNKRANRTWQQGMDLYLQRLKDNFGLKEVVGRITDTAHLEWANTNMK